MEGIQLDINTQASSSAESFDSDTGILDGSRQKSEFGGLYSSMQQSRDKQSDDRVHKDGSRGKNLPENESAMGEDQADITKSLELGTFEARTQLAQAAGIGQVPSVDTSAYNGSEEDADPQISELPSISLPKIDGDDSYVEEAVNVVSDKKIPEIKTTINTKGNNNGTQQAVSVSSEGAVKTASTAQQLISNYTNTNETSAPAAASGESSPVASPAYASTAAQEEKGPAYQNIDLANISAKKTGNLTRKARMDNLVRKETLMEKYVRSGSAERRELFTAEWNKAVPATTLFELSGEKTLAGESLYLMGGDSYSVTKMEGVYQPNRNSV